MNLFLNNLEGYKLLDSGNGYKLERFGDIVLRRPEPQAIWNKRFPDIWNSFDLDFSKDGKGFKWSFKDKEIKDWNISILGLNLILKLNNFKHTGLFPEQTIHWQWAGDLIEKHRINNKDKQIRILNLFGYTGGASLYLAKLGCEVTHIDASRQAISWAKENQNLNNKDGNLKIRYLMEDAIGFVEKELRRGAVYDAIVMDPPVYGKTSKGKKWILEENLFELLVKSKKLLSKNPILFLLSGYASGYSHNSYNNLLKDLFSDDISKDLKTNIESGELCIKEGNSERFLSAGIFARAKF